MICQGGWETDEDIFEAAERETVEEAGVVGDVQVSPFRFLIRLFFLTEVIGTSNKT